MNSPRRMGRAAKFNGGGKGGLFDADRSILADESQSIIQMTRAELQSRESLHQQELPNLTVG